MQCQVAFLPKNSPITLKFKKISTSNYSARTLLEGKVETNPKVSCLTSDQLPPCQDAVDSLICNMHIDTRRQVISGLCGDERAFGSGVTGRDLRAGTQGESRGRSGFAAASR